jgi:hypothetical protein
MTIKRAAAYGVLSVLVLAWLSAAASISRQTPTASDEPRQPVQTSGTETLAADVQAQAERLKQRLSTAPTPQEPSRNPFTFSVRPPQRQRRAPEPVDVAVPPPPIAVEPALELIGVAESQSPKGPIRTAIISTAAEDLFMVKEGETIAGRYRVVAVGPDAVELSDLVTGTVRRLALRS